MIKLVSDTIDREDINHLIQWLSQDEIPRLTKGELTWELEEKWAQKIGTKYSVFVNSGSSAILLTLAALKQSGELTNNKIVVPALSWSTDVSSPMLLDYEVLMCDCNLDDLSCDITYLEMLFKSHGPSALILVSPLGLVPEMDKITSLCKEYGVLLLEDVCESMGSKYQNQYLGSFGHASFFSLYFGHHLSTIEGGFINTNDEEYYNLLVSIRSHGWDRDCLPTCRESWREEHAVDDFTGLYTFYYPGLNVRSTDLQAVIGRRQLKKLDHICHRRNLNFFLYQEQISCCATEGQRSEDFVSNFAYPVLSSNRSDIIKRLQDNSVEVRPLIAGSMSKKPFLKKYIPNQHNKSYPNCDKIDDMGFYLPNHQDLTVDEIKLIADIVNS
jgi:CDP-6-deoxy-D-xylo-4-hexulose-3-dehydrase